MHVHGSSYEPHVSVTLNENDGECFDAVEVPRWGRKKGTEIPFLVRRVAFAGWTTFDETVLVSGSRYRKDGSVGVIAATAKMEFEHLPEVVRQAIQTRLSELIAKIKEEMPDGNQ